jgi:hypothetical protein
VDLPVRRRLDRDDLYVLVLEEWSAPRDGEVLDEVHLVALEPEDHRCFFVVELDVDLVRERLVAPVRLVAHHREPDLGCEALELERPRALERLPPVGWVQVGWDDDRVVVGRAHQGREVAVRRVEVEDDRRVVGRLDVSG